MPPSIPSALTASDRRAGYAYRFSIRQMELTADNVSSIGISRCWSGRHLQIGRRRREVDSTGPCSRVIARRVSLTASVHSVGTLELSALSRPLGP